MKKFSNPIKVAVAAAALALSVITVTRIVAPEKAQAASFIVPTQASVWQNAISNPIVCLHTSTNLTSAQYVRIPVQPGKGIAFAPQFYGADATNTGTIGFRCAIFYRTNSYITTTRPITFTSTANGTTVVRDWTFIPPSTLNGADSIAILTVTNALANISTATAGTTTISNVLWTVPLQ